jgi:hypothetical protein
MTYQTKKEIYYPYLEVQCEFKSARVNIGKFVGV